MQLTSDERAGGTLPARDLELAIDRVRNDGYVVFERALPADLVQEMQAAFSRVLTSHVQTADANRGVNRHQMHLPFELPFCDERVVANPLVLPVVEALVGQDCICHYLSSDTPLPGSDYQQTHPDIFSLFPESDGIMPPYSIVVNIPLVEAREDNGPLEVWPGGTHHYVADRSRVPDLASTMHSERLLMPAGSILIRDSRMWHRGTPNRSNAPRPNFTLIYSRYWLKLRYRPIPIPQRTYDGLSARAKRLFRLEDIGATGEGSADLEPDRFYGTG
jgi:ectoine hydroxylase-related dioxygenase (phytanoyl-CoA dioxygenase family)